MGLRQQLLKIAGMGLGLDLGLFFLGLDFLKHRRDLLGRQLRYRSGHGRLWDICGLWHSATGLHSIHHVVKVVTARLAGFLQCRRHLICGFFHCPHHWRWRLLDLWGSRRLRAGDAAAGTFLSSGAPTKGP
eukprot:Skav217695  [mRNA]  locus=scaffold1925:112746:115689:+ [translate_table: standard]